jgi:hypothetical protein
MCLLAGDPYLLNTVTFKVTELSKTVLIDDMCAETLSHTFVSLIFSGVHRNFFSGGGGSTNSVEYRGQREQRSGGGSPLVRGSIQFANE